MTSIHSDTTIVLADHTPPLRLSGPVGDLYFVRVAVSYDGNDSVDLAGSLDQLESFFTKGLTAVQGAQDASSEA